MEVRQRPRPTGERWFDSVDLGRYLQAFGDVDVPLAETVRVLDIMAVDFVIETCYEAESHARYAGRQKVKVDDFQFALRNDPKKLGRIQEMAEKEKSLKVMRKGFDISEGEVAKGARADGEAKPKGKRGRKKKVSLEEEGAGESSAKGRKRRKSEAGSAVAVGGGIGEDDLDVEEMEDD